MQRHINDHRTMDNIRFTGTAHYVAFTHRDSPGTTGLRAFESGELSCGDYHGESQRSLEYFFGEDALVHVHFSDGRPFVDFDFSTGDSLSTHHCGEDDYEIAINVESDEVFRERWRVSGPKKDYVAVTTFTRASASSLEFPASKIRLSMP